MRKHSGFTLIEVMIVIVIIAILSAISLPSYQNYIIKAKIKEAQSNLIGLSLSVESNYQRQLKYHSKSLDSTESLKEEFTTWSPSSDSFSYSYQSIDNGKGFKGFKLEAKGKDKNVEDCTLTINQANEKTITGCRSITSWVN